MTVPPTVRTLPQVFPRTDGTCRMTTPERLATFSEQFCFCRHKGQLVLDDRQITFSDTATRMVIPLVAIRDLSIGRFPRVMNPEGLHFISVTYDDAGQSRRVILSPFQGVIGLPSRFNQLAAEWFDSIRGAVTAATGRAPASTPADKLGTPPGSIWIIVLFVGMALILMIPCLLMLTLPREKGIAWTAITTGACGVVLLATVCVALLVAMRTQARTAARVAPESPTAMGPARWTIAWHTVLLLAVLGLFVFVVPRFLALFLDFGVQLPGVTVLTLTLSHVLTRFGILLFPALLALDAGLCILTQLLVGRWLRNVWSALVVAGCVLICLVALWSLCLPLSSCIQDVSPTTRPSHGGGGPPPSSMFINHCLVLFTGGAPALSPSKGRPRRVYPAGPKVLEKRRGGAALFQNSFTGGARPPGSVRPDRTDALPRTDFPACPDAWGMRTFDGFRMTARRGRCGRERMAS